MTQTKREVMNSGVTSFSYFANPMVFKLKYAGEFSVLKSVV